MEQKFIIGFFVIIGAVLTAVPSVSSAVVVGKSLNAAHSTELQNTQPTTVSSGVLDQGPTRNKRAIIFRPLFVYRQQEIKKQKLKEMRQQQQQQQQQQVVHRISHQPSTRKPVRYYAQYYPYQQG
ncbi:hypothetical protein ZHAS_00016333 [Anopheles sinensis]|uniref:Uncharacterized protein n=1 Tax=Anopheles sinensis TaxID=74873 RepID=A0A084WDC0_ANOSI|nr:hypothetical protein ZHAS_00016333 [Anopheles sinensis]